VINQILVKFMAFFPDSKYFELDIYHSLVSHDYGTTDKVFHNLIISNYSSDIFFKYLKAYGAQVVLLTPSSFSIKAKIIELILKSLERIRPCNISSLFCFQEAAVEVTKYGFVCQLLHAS
jgi:hypothetical protein